MKTPILLSLLALAGSTAFAADPNSTPQPPPGVKVVPPKPPTSVPVPAGSSPAAEVSGKATITIDVGGKKVTREIDLGKAMQIKVGDVTTTQVDSGKPKGPAEVRTWLGVATDEPADEVRAQLPVAIGTGLLVREVVADSPAAKAGLEKNDVLTRLDDQILTNPGQLRALVGLKKDGDTVHLAYLRKGHEASVEVKLATHAEENAGDLPGGTGKLLLNKVIEKAAGAGVAGLVAPLVLESYAAFDKDGNLTLNAQQGQPGAGQDGAVANLQPVGSWVISSAASRAGNDGAASNEQWHLYLNGAHADVTEPMKQLGKTLRDAGASEQVIAQTRQAVADAIAQLQKALSDASAPKDEIQRNARKALEEVRSAIEQTWRSEEGEASKEPPRVAPKTTP